MQSGNFNSQTYVNQNFQQVVYTPVYQPQVQQQFNHGVNPYTPYNQNYTPQGQQFSQSQQSADNQLPEIQTINAPRAQPQTQKNQEQNKAGQALFGYMQNQQIVPQATGPSPEGYEELQENGAPQPGNSQFVPMANGPSPGGYSQNLGDQGQQGTGYIPGMFIPGGISQHQGQQ